MNQIAEFDTIGFDTSIFDKGDNNMATINVLMDGDKMCIAWFKKKVKKYTLTTNIEPSGGGTITGAGIYDKGTIVTVGATPAVDYEFDHWEGDIS